MSRPPKRIDTLNKYIVISIPTNRQYEDMYDTTTYNFETLQQALEFMEIAISSSSDCILQLSKEQVGD